MHNKHINTRKTRTEIVQVVIAKKAYEVKFDIKLEI